MLFQREKIDDEEDEDLEDEHRLIAFDLKDSYVESSKYEEAPVKRKKGFFGKIKNKHHNDFESYLNEGLFVIQEEPYNERLSISNRNSTNLGDSKGSQTKKNKKGKKWIELKEINNF